MDVRSLSKLVLPACAVLLLATGCPSVAPPENAVTWGVKAAAGQLTQTTPTEWQAVAEKIDLLTPQVDVSLTTGQATAVVDFLQANNLNTVGDITELVQRAQTDPSTTENIEIPDSVMELFGQVDFESVSGEILGGV